MISSRYIPRIGDIIRHKTDPADHHFHVIDKRGTYITVAALVTGKEMNLTLLDVHRYYEIVVTDWPTPLGTKVRQRLSGADEHEPITWSVAMTVRAHETTEDGDVICCCLGLDFSGREHQFFYLEGALRDGSVRIDSLPEPPRRKLGRRLEL